MIAALKAGTLTRRPAHAYTYAIPYALDGAQVTVESPRRLGRPVIVSRSTFEARWGQVLSGGASQHRLCVVLSASRAALPTSKPMG
ncbi:MAG: hypothetical protein IPG96_15345 [Proteobacteria bacterium]|nr:hypothetical protein [Pseudomonadota bacterium]